MFKLFSVLLQYPDDELVSSVPRLRDGLAHSSDGSYDAGCRSLLQYLESTPLIVLQQEYVQTFDLRQSTCLNLTFHECGDTKIRGLALAELSQWYKSAGYESSAKELPDFLPLVLEFLSVCSSEHATQIIERYIEQIRRLALRLHEGGSPYAALLEALSLFAYEFMTTGD
jgi:nitrate reductase delta subunit